ncbi:MAG: hypothetical protein WCI04_05100 [archaeon]
MVDYCVHNSTKLCSWCKQQRKEGAKDLARKVWSLLNKNSNDADCLQEITLMLKPLVKEGKGTK